MLKMRETPDSELATPEAINFRIEKLRRELGNNNRPAPLLKRIEALKMRLPKTPGAAIVPAVDPVLLLSKSDLDWDGRKPQQYAAV